jgi:hypothetical protein
MGIVILSTIMGYFYLGVLILLAIVGLVLGWKFSNLFIPPSDNWHKSFIVIIGIKIGIAVGGAYAAVVGGAYLMAKILELFS